MAEALPRLHGLKPDPRVTQLIMALMEALERGEIQLRLAGASPPEGVSPEGWPEAHIQAIRSSPLAQAPDGALVLLGDRLCWRRWQEQRQAVLEALVGRVAAPAAAFLQRRPIPGSGSRLDDLQRRSVSALFEHGLVVLEGGPGTGKTSTVAAMVEAMRQTNPSIRMHLSAPTGKAAARLRSATGSACPCTTLHRLLESRGDRFARDRRHPLALDLLVVDEMSMVDLALMAALLEALPANCRLVLVGDPAQLAPLNPGAVFLDLQHSPWRERLGEARVTLCRTYRNAGAIAAVTARLRAESPADADPLERIRVDLERLSPGDNLRWLEARPPTLPEVAVLRMREHLAALNRLAGSKVVDEPDGLSRVLRERDRLLVLAPMRRGPWGLEALHRAVLGDCHGGPWQRWPAGTPVLCTRNRPELALANGDVGVLLGGESAPQRRRLLFGDREADAVLVHPAQLAGACEPALAMTIHKAQGSEAEEVIVLMPPNPRPERRLLYTALTRARRQALLITAAA